MTPRHALVVHEGDISLCDAQQIMTERKIKKLPLVATDDTVMGLITAKDLIKHREHPFATRDDRGRLRVAAAVGATGDYLERAVELERADADVIVVDIAHGHSMVMQRAIEALRKRLGAIDLVVQIESPPSVASGMQRIGRASHRVGAVSKGTIFPKYRADLVACAAVTRAMYEGRVESTHYPRNALDVLAQQIVAMVSMDPWSVNDLFHSVRGAAPYASLTRPMFESVLDMLSGRYPSDEFAELRPRITWDRVSGMLTPREGARSIAIINGGTIPDRGLYGVFLAGATKSTRVGELDEEMVFESRTGDTIILGASTWRIEEITQDQVRVSPAPGEPGKMPFWHGDTAGRPAEFGEGIGQMTRELLRLPRPAAFTKLVEDHSLEGNAAENLLRYLEEQKAATERVPSDQDVIIERCRDELGGLWEPEHPASRHEIQRAADAFGQIQHDAGANQRTDRSE
jgi:hypothetical protein